MARQAQLESWWRQASDLLASGSPVRALPLLKKLAAAMPNDPAVHYNLGACLIEIGRPGEAYPHLKHALTKGYADSAIDSLFARVAAWFYSLRRFDEAIGVLRDVLSRHPDNTQLSIRLGDLLREVGRFGEAFVLFDRSLARRIGLAGRDSAYLLNALGATHQNIGALAEARDAYGRALAADPSLIVTHKSIRNLLLNMPRLGSEELFASYCDSARSFRQSAAPRDRFAMIDRTPGRRLRIGYVSSDFRMHVVGLNLLPLVENHDRDAVDIFFYSDAGEEDQVTQRFKAVAAGWRPVAGLDDASVARAILTDSIDVAVFLAGTFDATRVCLAAYRVAPVQVSFHDCATSGLDEMDYFLSDHLLTPQNTSERFTEEIYCLPVFYQYLRLDAPKRSAPPPVMKAGSITFASFNKPEKINDRVIALWARILSAVPGSRLLMKYFDFYRGPEAQTRIAALFAERNIGRDRLEFRSGHDARGNHLALYDHVDVALDTFPFTGATTTFEALNAGVPVVSLWGDRYVARYAGAILCHAGFPEFACVDEEIYFETACALANDPARLSELRSILPERIASSPLCDGSAYARSVEAAYREMWVRFCAAES